MKDHDNRLGHRDGEFSYVRPDEPVEPNGPFTGLVNGLLIYIIAAILAYIGWQLYKLWT